MERPIIFNTFLPWIYFLYTFFSPFIWNNATIHNNSRKGNFASHLIHTQPKITKKKLDPTKFFL